MGKVIFGTLCQRVEWKVIQGAHTGSTSISAEKLCVIDKLSYPDGWGRGGGNFLFPSASASQRGQSEAE